MTDSTRGDLVGRQRGGQGGDLGLVCGAGSAAPSAALTTRVPEAPEMAGKYWLAMSWAWTDW